MSILSLINLGTGIGNKVRFEVGYFGVNGFYGVAPEWAGYLIVIIPEAAAMFGGYLLFKDCQNKCNWPRVSDSWKGRIYSKKNWAKLYIRNHSMIRAIFLSLDFIDVNNLANCILSNRTFSNYIMPVKLQ